MSPTVSKVRYCILSKRWGFPILRTTASLGFRGFGFTLFLSVVMDGIVRNRLGGGYFVMAPTYCNEEEAEEAGVEDEDTST